jgi:hypothetical protein
VLCIGKQATKYRSGSFKIRFMLDETSKLMSGLHGSHSDRELLTLQAKSELVLAAQDDLQKLAEESKEIQALQQCAEIGGLKSKGDWKVSTC